MIGRRERQQREEAGGTREGREKIMRTELLYRMEERDGLFSFPVPFNFANNNNKLIQRRLYLFKRLPMSC